MFEIKFIFHYKNASGIDESTRKELDRFATDIFTEWNENEHKEDFPNIYRYLRDQNIKSCLIKGAK